MSPTHEATRIKNTAIALVAALIGTLVTVVATNATSPETNAPAVEWTNLSLEAGGTVYAGPIFLSDANETNKGYVHTRYAGTATNGIPVTILLHGKGADGKQVQAYVVVYGETRDR